MNLIECYREIEMKWSEQEGKKRKWNSTGKKLRKKMKMKKKKIKMNKSKNKNSSLVLNPYFEVSGREDKGTRWPVSAIAAGQVFFSQIMLVCVVIYGRQWWVFYVGKMSRSIAWLDVNHGKAKILTTIQNNSDCC